MRRAFVLLLLLGGLRLIVPLGSAGQGSQVLLAFGFLILAAYTVGEIASDVRLPKIVGYLAAGMLFGPSALGVVGDEPMARLAPVSQLAVALIAFVAGAELRWSELRLRGSAMLKIVTVELGLAFLGLAVLLYLLQDQVPFLREAPTRQMVAFSLMFAAIGVAHSPAATIAVLSETSARGPVARTTLGIVLLSDVAVLVLFSMATSAARVLFPPSGAAAHISLAAVAWEIGGSLIVGGLLGGAIALYLRIVKRELLLFGILIAFFGAEIATFAGVDALLTLLVAGFLTENLSKDEEGEALRHAVERVAAPVFVVFFALSGARIDLSVGAALLVPLVPLVLVRAGTIWAGVRLGSRWAGLPPAESRHLWLGLISQAGVAIGLASVVAELYPELGPPLRTLLLSLIAANQLAGPILFRRALVVSGEAVGRPRAAPRHGRRGLATDPLKRPGAG